MTSFGLLSCFLATESGWVAFQEYIGAASRCGFALGWVWLGCVAYVSLFIRVVWLSFSSCSFTVHSVTFRGYWRCAWFPRRCLYFFPELPDTAPPAARARWTETSRLIQKSRLMAERREAKRKQGIASVSFTCGRWARPPPAPTDRTPPYQTLPYPTLPYSTPTYSILPYPTVPYPTLPYPPLPSPPLPF